MGTGRWFYHRWVTGLLPPVSLTPWCPLRPPPFFIRPCPLLAIQLERTLTLFCFCAWVHWLYLHGVPSLLQLSSLCRSHVVSTGHCRCGSTFPFFRCIYMRSLYRPLRPYCLVGGGSRCCDQVTLSICFWHSGSLFLTWASSL